MANKIWTRNYRKTKWPRFYLHISQCKLKTVNIFWVYQAFEQVAKRTTYRHVYIGYLWYLSKQKGLFGGLISQLQYLLDLRYAYAGKKKSTSSLKCFNKDHLHTNSCNSKKPPTSYMFMLLWIKITQCLLWSRWSDFSFTLI